MLISATRISEWASINQRQAQDTLPELVRRLIWESDPQVKKADIPSGDSVALPGLDGVVISERGFCPEQFLPDGESVWEFGCSKDIKTKANKDYQKRSEDFTINNKENKTYMEVSPHPWIKKASWVKEKQKQKLWKDVLALNAEDLAQWLDRCHRTRDWFASTVLGYDLSELAADVLPVLLLTGGWDTRYEADKKVVESISGHSHESLEKNLQRLSQDQHKIGASLFQKANSQWKLLDPGLAWEITEQYVTEATFIRFFEQSVIIFTEIPIDYIPPNEQTEILIHYIGKGYSDLLKQGLTEALARIATTDNKHAPGYNGHLPQRLVDFYLDKIFKQRYEPAFWVTISPYLSILAQAWDGGMLDCLEDVLQNKSEALSHLFQKPNNIFLSSRALPGLLFALQKLAWYPPHLSRVANILLLLKPFDTEKSNDWGPIRVFQELFIGWYANTAATLEEQRKILSSTT